MKPFLHDEQNPNHSRSTPELNVLSFKGPGAPLHSHHQSADNERVEVDLPAFRQLQLPGGSFTMSEENANNHFNSSRQQHRKYPFLSIPSKSTMCPQPVPGRRTRALLAGCGGGYSLA